MVSEFSHDRSIGAQVYQFQGEVNKEDLNMSDINVKLDRRSFLKALAAAGASTTILSTVGYQAVQAQGPAVEGTAAPEFLAALPGAAYGKTVALATAGPMGNKDWKPGDAEKFVPPEGLIKGKYAEAFAKLGKEKLLAAYKSLWLMRKWSTTAKDNYVDPKLGLYGDFHINIGQEACTAGTMLALNPDDFVISNHRGHNHLIGKGLDLKAWTAEICEKATGTSKGYGHEMHVFDLKKGFLGTRAIVGGSWLPTTGAGYACLVHGKKQVAVGFGGEGANQSVYYFNAVQMAALYKIPSIFIIENQFYSSGGVSAKITATKYNADLTKGLGVPSITIDGNDMAAVYNAVAEAVARARAGNGPSVIEMMTYRWYDHSGFAGAKTGVDGAFGLPYRTDSEVRAWMARCPILRMNKWLIEQKIATDAELKAAEAEAAAENKAAWEFGLSSPKCKPEDGLKNTWAFGDVEATQFLDRKGPAKVQATPEYVMGWAAKEQWEA